MALVGSIFGFEPSNPGLIPDLCVTLCFLIWIQIMMLNKWGSSMEYQFHVANHGPSWKQVIGLVMPSMQNKMILSYHI